MISAKNEKPGCLGRIVILIISLAVVTCLIAYSNYRDGKETPETRKAANCRHGNVIAHTMAEHYVEQRLKSPSTAKFPWYRDSQVSYVGECEFIVQSYVDAQNSFGAMLRSDYSVRLKYDPNSDSYSLLDIRIGK
jgi:hypothetical protein